MIHSIDLDVCIGCGICDPVCPADVIHMNPATNKPVIAYIQHCITCFNCELFCPVDCIDVFPVVKARPLPWSVDERQPAGRGPRGGQGMGVGGWESGAAGGPR